MAQPPKANPTFERPEFGRSFRGFDSDEVTAFLDKVEAQVHELTRQLTELRTENACLIQEVREGRAAVNKLEELRETAEERKSQIRELERRLEENSARIQANMAELERDREALKESEKSAQEARQRLANQSLELEELNERVEQLRSELEQGNHGRGAEQEAMIDQLRLQNRDLQRETNELKELLKAKEANLAGLRKHAQEEDQQRARQSEALLKALRNELEASRNEIDTLKRRLEDDKVSADTILRAADKAAKEMVQDAEKQAARIVEDAQQHADQIRERMKKEVESLRQEREQAAIEYHRFREKIREMASDIVQRAEEEGYFN